jgi:hypothetical protein
VEQKLGKANQGWLAVEMITNLRVVSVDIPWSLDDRTEWAHRMCFVKTILRETNLWLVIFCSHGDDVHGECPTGVGRGHLLWSDVVSAH